MLREVETWDRIGARMRAPGARKGEKKGMESVIGRLLNDMKMFPAGSNASQL